MRDATFDTGASGAIVGRSDCDAKSTGMVHARGICHVAQ